jgi:hypothetical protein
MRFGLGLEKAGTNLDIMKRAFELGVRFFDTAPTYGYGMSESNFGIALRNSGVSRSDVTISTKTHDRIPDNALKLLDKSLIQLETDYIDIWSLHDLSTPYDLKVIPALDQAKKSGKVKYVGITSNRDPLILKEALQSYQFDYVMMSMNIADKHQASFIDNVLPYVGNTKVIAMQVFMRGLSRYPLHSFVMDQISADLHKCPHDQAQMNLTPGPGTTPISGMWVCPSCGHAGAEDLHAFQGLQDCMNYVASFPIDVMLIGCSSVAKLEQDWALFNTISPITEEQKTALENKTLPYADMLNFFKTPFKKKN